MVQMCPEERQLQHCRVKRGKLFSTQIDEWGAGLRFLFSWAPSDCLSVDASHCVYSYLYVLPLQSIMTSRLPPLVQYVFMMVTSENVEYSEIQKIEYRLRQVDDQVHQVVLSHRLGNIRFFVCVAAAIVAR